MAKRRLDLLLTERGLVPSRERAKSLIMAGVVYVNGQKEDKAGTGFDPDPDKIRSGFLYQSCLDRDQQWIDTLLIFETVFNKGQDCQRQTFGIQNFTVQRKSQFGGF